MRQLIALLLALAGLGHAPALLAQACTSAATGNWTTAGTWNAPCNVAGGPTAANTVTIQNNHRVTVTLAGGAVAANSITIAGGAGSSRLDLLNDLTVTNAVTINAPTSNGITKEITVNTRTLTVGGDVTINGGTAGGTAATRISQLIVTTGTVTIGTPAQNRNLIITAGTATTNLAQVSLSGATGLITVNGNVTLTGGAAVTADALLTIANASNVGRGYVITGNLSVLSPSIAGSASVTMTGAAGGRISVGGNVTNQDTMALAAGIFTATGAGSTFAIGNAAVTAASHVTSTTVTSGSLTIAGNTTVTGGARNPSGATMSVTTGTITIGTVATPRNLSITSGSINTSIATASVTGAQGLLDVKGDVTLTGGNAANLHALLNVSGIGAVGRGVLIGGNLLVTSGAATRATVQMTGVTAGANASRIRVTGNVTNRDRIFANTGVFTANGTTFATTSTIGNAITQVTTGSLDIAGNATVNASTTTTSTATMTVSTGRISVVGDLTVTGGNNGALRNALLSVTGAPAVAGNGINVNGTLSTVLSTGAVTSASISITAANGVVNANGNFINNGTFNNNAVAGRLFLGGATSTINGSFIRGTGTVTMDGVAPLAVTQALSGTALTQLPAANGFNNLTVSNTTGLGVTLGGTVAVKGTLTLTEGTVTTGVNSLVTVPSCALPSVLRTNGYVIGNLQKTIPAGASSCTFEVGTLAGFIPIGTAFPGGTGTGNVTASATGTEHPSHGVGPSGINTARSVNRYWTLTNGPTTFITVPGAGFIAAFNFITPGDYDGGATDPAKFTVQRFSGGAWSSPAVNASCTPIAGPYLCNQVNGLTVAAGFGDFAVGEANYTGGNAGWFNVFETSTGAGATVGNIFTKIVGAGFSLDVVAINAFRNGVKPNYSTNPITVELLDASDNSGALNTETNCRASWALIPGQSYSLSPGWASSRSTIAIPAQTAAAREVRMRVTQGTLAGCSTNNFSIRPTGFTVSSTNATNNGTSGAPTFRAGSDTFNLTATAVAGYNGTPSVDNTAGMVIGTPTQGSIGGSFSAAPILTGIASGSAFTYSEVGNFGLAANAVFDSSFTSVDAAGVDCVVGFSNVISGGGQYGCSIGSTAVAQTTGASGFGRFKPDHFFLVAGSTLTNRSVLPCAPASTFTYMDENFQLGFTLRARNASNVVTANYQGDYAKLDLSSAAALALGARFGTTNLTPRLDTALAPGGSFVAGDAALTMTLRVTRAAAPDGPFAAARVGIAPNDNDPLPATGTQLGLTALDLDVDNNSTNDHQQVGANTEFRFGRLRLVNAAGSEKIDLPIPLEAQYWTGSAFSTNTLDGCTSLSAANLAFSAYTGGAGGISAANMNAANISLGGAFTLGVGNLKLTKPTTPVPTIPGSTTLTINLAAESKTYLQGNWGVPMYTANPSARATFGLYSSQPRNFIYFRENY